MTRRTVWTEGSEPGPAVVALGCAVTLTVAVADLALGGGIGRLFDVGFVLVCLGLALQVREGDFFTVGVLPPLLLAGVLAILAWGSFETWFAALSGHVEALVVGYLLSLAVLEIRRRVLIRTGPDHPLPV